MAARPVDMAIDNDIQARPTDGFGLIDAARAPRGTRVQLATAVPRVAHRLANAGVEPGQLIAVPATHPAELFVFLMAAARLGLAVMPLPSTLTDDARADIFTTAGVDWWLPSGISATPQRVTTAAQCPEPTAPTDTGLRLVVLTSGSTGSPRGVMLDANSLSTMARVGNARLGFGPRDTWLVCLPARYIGGLAPFYRCALAGATLVSLPSFDAATTLHCLRQHAVTHVSLVPAMLVALLECGETPPPTLRVALLGGQALDPTLASRAHAAGWPVCVTYGMSETASHVAVDCGPAAGICPGRVGRPLDGLRVQAGTPDAPVRIRVQGATLMRGYANPARQPYRGLEDGWLLTNDLGYLDREGQLVVLGRADDVLISGGIKVHPDRLEADLGHCPDIGRVGVAGLDDPRWGQRLVAVYTGSASVPAVAAWCQQNLPGTLRPRAFVQVDTLPLLGSGKLDRRRLKGIAAQASHHALAPPP